MFFCFLQCIFCLISILEGLPKVIVFCLSRSAFGSFLFIKTDKMNIANIIVEGFALEARGFEGLLPQALVFGWGDVCSF